MKKLSSGGFFLPSGVTPDGMPIQGNRPAAFDPATVKTDEDWRMLIHGLIDNMRYSEKPLTLGGSIAPLLSKTHRELHAGPSPRR